MKIDLHMHSSYSGDGEHSPEKLVMMAKELGIDVVALTDHDTINGVNEMLEAGKKHGIKVIPAIEISCQVCDNVTHILGYNINPNSKRFSEYLQNIIDMENAAIKENVILFKKVLDMDYDVDEMLKKCESASVFYIPILDELLNSPKHKDKEIVKPYLPGGSRDDLPLVNFYWDNCIKGKELYVEIPYIDYRKVIDEIHQDGGIAVLAHPNTMYYQQYELLDKLIAAGLDGIEAFSNYHNKEKNDWYLAYALEKGLLVSGGSDYHGSYKPNVFMGEYGCDDQKIFEPLINRLIGE